MEFVEVIKKRRSTRKFQDKDVPLKIVREMVELANSSPSAGNLQARSVMIIQNKKMKDEIRSAVRGFSKFTTEIPVIVVILAKLDESAQGYGERGRDLYALQDATIFASYLQLIATSKGFATRWVGSFNEDDIKKILKLPTDLRPIAMIPIGVSAEEPEDKERKPLEEIVYKEI
ncbi:nitroreductase family protein [Candidatus Microgenomates bacterium]|nr:MAG: nitroreductase family protein [Candidatus Microgenomates bacterium]